MWLGTTPGKAWHPKELKKRMPHGIRPLQENEGVLELVRHAEHDVGHGALFFVGADMPHLFH